MIPNYTLPQAIEFIQQQTNIDDTQHITNLLESSKSAEVYRVYYVCALLFWLKPSNNLIKGEGAQFDQMVSVTYRYLNIQKNIDNALGLVVDPNFSCDTLLAALNAENSTQVESEQQRSKSVGFLSINF